MAGHRSFVALLAASWMLVAVPVSAQDVPGIEICTVDKTMERRTSCLQSNVNFLVGMINKLTRDQQQKLDAANRQVEALKAVVATLQKNVETMQADLQAAQKKSAPPAKDTPAAK